MFGPSLKIIRNKIKKKIEPKVLKSQQNIKKNNPSLKNIRKHIKNIKILNLSLKIIRTYLKNKDFRPES